jgi:hypothetical protein
MSLFGLEVAAEIKVEAIQVYFGDTAVGLEVTAGGGRIGGGRSRLDGSADLARSA